MCFGFQSKHGEVAFSGYAGCKKWDKLPTEVKSATSVNDFLSMPSVNGLLSIFKSISMYAIFESYFLFLYF